MADVNTMNFEEVMDVLGVQYPYTYEDAKECLESYGNNNMRTSSGRIDPEQVEFYKNAQQRIQEHFFSRMQKVVDEDALIEQLDQPSERYNATRYADILSSYKNTSLMGHASAKKDIRLREGYGGGEPDITMTMDDMQDGDEVDDMEANDLGKMGGALVKDVPKDDPQGYIMEPEQRKATLVENLTLKPTKLILNIDSIFRENYHSTLSNDFSIKLPYVMNNVLSLRLSSIEIPNTWYMFSNTLGNTTFDMTVTNVSGVSETETVRIPEGNWSFANLQNAFNKYFDNHEKELFRFVQTKLSTNSGKFMFFIRNYDSYRTVAQSGKTDADKFEEYYTQVFGDSPNQGSNTWTTLIEESFPGKQVEPGDDISGVMTLKLDFYNGTLTDDVDGIYLSKALTKTAGWMLGYRNRSYVSSVSPANTFYEFGDSYLSPIMGETVAGVSKNNYIYFCVDDHLSSNTKDAIISKKNDTFESQNILGRINIKYGSFFVNIDDSDSVFKERQYAGAVTLERLSIKIIDRYGEILDINGSDYSLLFEVVQLQ